MNLKKLFTALWDKTHEIINIKYYTAHISDRDGNSDSRLRQKYYLQAIQHYIPELEIHYGHYLTHKVNAKVVNPPPNFIKIYKTETVSSCDIRHLKSRKCYLHFLHQTLLWIPIVINQNHLKNKLTLITNELKHVDRNNKNQIHTHK